MFSTLRYILTCLLVILLSGTSSAFIVLKQAVSYTEQNEKIESESFVDVAIPSIRSKKQVSKPVNHFLQKTKAETKAAFEIPTLPQAIREEFLFIKYRRLII